MKLLHMYYDCRLPREKLVSFRTPTRLRRTLGYKMKESDGRGNAGDFGAGWERRFLLGFSFEWRCGVQRPRALLSLSNSEIN